ncbi:MAG TPA: pyridoxamine 5'-phosphate oxidase family protein [Actinomycetota bacterium]|jgi:PPOX class probable F420-dependent enzyme|nr:pyridoxamine 5'-phosphate oxidase family protein [Actinomycetota bacterium]
MTDVAGPRTAEVTAARRMFGGLPTLHVATLGRRGEPHVVPLWFVWPEDAVYVSTRQGSGTWRNVERDPRVSMSVDVGRAWTELVGVTISGRAELLEAERPETRSAISAWHDKYRALFAGEGFSRFAEEIDRLGFVRVEVDRLVGWDHART